MDVELHERSESLRDWLIAQGLGVVETATGFAVDDGEVCLGVAEEGDRSER